MHRPDSRLTRLDGSFPDAGEPDAGEPDADEPLALREIGRFSVLRKLGEGGMGVVYAAHDAELDRDVAIKLLHPAAGDSDGARARLLREARAMAKLSHPNVITIYDVGTLDDRVFIAMELVHGTTLRQWLRERPRTWRGVLERFVEAGQGLAAAHAAGLIHRDFKPDNVLVGLDGVGRERTVGRVRVLDFGLARRIDVHPTSEPTNVSPKPLPDDARLTVTGAVMGTPAYMAPEQWRSQAIDHRTDQFSFCVALWEALFGSRPFQGEGEGVQSLAMRVLTAEQPEPPPDHSIPGWLVRVLQRGLSTEPDDRYATMNELLAVLGRLRRNPGEMDASTRPHPPLHDAPLFARRYELRIPSTIGGRAVARDRLTRRLVAILPLPGPPSDPSDARPAMASRRLRTLVGLQHPNLAAVLDYGVAEGGAYVVTEHFEGEHNPVAWGREQPEAIRLNLLVQLLRVVAYLHAHDVVHGSLSPHSVGVVDGQIKVHDPTAYLTGVVADEASLSYAAPEILLDEKRQPQSDLYSVGVLAHELLTGRRPHRAEAPGERVDEALRGMLTLDEVELGRTLAPVVARLLETEPHARFASADEALRALLDAAGLPLTTETVETRESALRTARFVGRESEQSRLVTALRRCLDGSGETWLLAGESGVGKSRLLDELAAEAMSRGVAVIRGQAKTEGGRPYEVWREPFRYFALHARDDRVAGALATAVPDVDELRGHKVERPAALDAKNAQVRLQRAVVQSLKTLERPVLLLLEDLQWARSESIALLERVAAAVNGLPMLVVGSHRDDEAPHLAEQVPGAKSIALSRLDPAAVVELARTTTGASSSELARLLERETEGNAFFLVEVLRYLAEEAGDLRSIATMQLPESVVSGGVRRVMRRRLERVEAWARPQLELAAVSGRILDVALLERLGDHPDPDADVERFFAHCHEHAVLEQQEGRWRFRHDKLREHVLSTLPPERRRELHRCVAEAIEALYGTGDSHTQALAHHYCEAGDLKGEARFAGPAGEQALRGGAYADAVRLLSRAIELREHAPQSGRDVVRWYRMLGDAHYVLGDLSRAVQTLEHALRELGRPLPASRLGWTFLLLRLVFVQAILLLLPGRLVARSPQRRQQLREGASAAGRIANLTTYSGDQLRIVGASLLAANLSERAGEPNPYSLAVMGYSASYMAMRRLADRYFERASRAAREQDDPTALVEGTQMECAYRLGLGQLSRVQQLLDEGYAAAERAGYQLGLALSEGFLGHREYLLGNFEAMLALHTRARELLSVRSPEHEHSFICHEALALCMLGRLEEADRLLTEATDRVGAHYLLGDAFVLTGRTLVHAFAREHEAAMKMAGATRRYVADHGIAVPGPCGQILGAPAEAMLASAEASGEADLVDAARPYVSTLRTWARKHPIGEASALLAQARLHALDGQTEVAIEHAEQALTSARRLSLRFVQAQAEHELGLLRGTSDEAGRDHLERARNLYQRCGASRHEEGVAELLVESPERAARTARVAR